MRSAQPRKKPWLIGEHRLVYMTLAGDTVLVGYVRERINPKRHSVRFYQYRMHAAKEWAATRFATIDEAEAALLVAVAKHQ
jgi:hypothetical protein